MNKPERREGDGAGSVAQRWLWFAALWLLGVGVVSVIAFAIRALILP
jgi:hypothetical protein